MAKEKAAPLRVWQLCRVCAGSSAQMIPIFEKVGKLQNIAEKIHKYLPITIKETDRLPVRVCETCVSSLEACHKLVECCTHADVTLKQLLHEEEKVEFPSDGEEGERLKDNWPSDESLRDSESKSPELEVKQEDGIKPDSDVSHTLTLARTRQQQKNNNSANTENSPTKPSIHSSGSPGKSKQFSCWECGTSLDDLQTFMQHQHQIHARALHPCQVCGNIFETEPELKTHCEEKHPQHSKEVVEPERKVPAKRNRRKSPSPHPPESVCTRRMLRTTRSCLQKSIPKPASTRKKNLTVKIVASEPASKCPNTETSSSDDCLDADESYIPDEKPEPKTSAYHCKICSKGYESKSGRRNHYVSAHNKHECKVCEELFLTAGEAEMHEKQPHKIACSQCPEYFQSQSSLKMHVSSKHLEGPKQYKCSQCGRDYVSKSALLTHEKLHKIKEPSICDVCNKSCKTPTALKYHKFVHMSDEEKAKVGFACTMCEKKFPGKTRLTLHMRRHTDERPCECPTCHKTFHDSERLKAHMEGHSTEKRFKCDQCDACFVSKRYLVNHMYLSHRRRQVIRCVVCKMVFPSMNEVMRHQQTHTAEEIAQSNCGSQPFTKSIEFHCKECNEYFSRKDMLRLHKARYHAKERVPNKSNVPIKQLECKVCGKKVWGTAGLGRHMRVHTGEAPARTFQCEFCAKLFAQKMQMVLHIRTHTGEKPFRCQFCEKGFINVNSLVVHERIHTGENPFQCDKCPKAFRSNSNLVAHLQTHSDIKPYECHYCHKRFGRLIHLKLHLRTHTGERPYVCDICGRAFTQGGDMRKHRLTHTGERAYKCCLCDFSSNKRKTLNEHQLAIHPSSRPMMVAPMNQEIQHHTPQIVHVQSLQTTSEYPQPSSSYLKLYENWSEN